MAYVHIPSDEFKRSFSSYTELSSAALGGVVTSVSDEFFAEAFHLLEVEAAPSLKGRFGPNGALYSGWESRRHNTGFDWCIIKLGAPSHLHGFDIDTSNFNGNEAPEASVGALFSEARTPPTASDDRWKAILPRVSLGPNARHLFEIRSPPESTYNYVKLNIYPDGGIARFRVYGTVVPTFPSDPSELLDLAHVLAGGRVVFTSDQHFGTGSNLLLPGRGKDMGDGWETKRSRVTGHKDWVIIRLGDVGILEHLEIDTNHFKGNFPESCEVHAIHAREDVPTATEGQWTTVLSRTKLGPHRRHYFQLENVFDKYFTHIRVTIYPDGGIKRVRVIGCRSQGASNGQTQPKRIKKGLGSFPPDLKESQSPSQVAQKPTKSPIPVLPLTTEAFAAFGHVLMAWVDPSAAPRGIRVTSANQGTAYKFHNLSLVESSYPTQKNARTGLSVYRSTPVGARLGEEWEVKLLERHPCTNQAFIPMGSGSDIGEDGLCDTARVYLVVVALNGEDDRPDLKTLRAFFATTSQGIVYNTGVWHHPMVTLEKPIDFTCVETQVGGDALDCEVLELDRLAGLPVLSLPSL